MTTSQSKSFSDTILSGSCTAIIMQRTPKGVRFTKGGCLVCGGWTSRRTMKPLTEHNGLNRAPTLLTLAMGDLGDKTRSPLCTKHWGSSYDMERLRPGYIGYRRQWVDQLICNEWSEDLMLLHWLTGGGPSYNQHPHRWRGKNVSREEYDRYSHDAMRTRKTNDDVEDVIDWWYENYWTVITDISFEELLIVQKAARSDIMAYTDDSGLRQAIRDSDSFAFIRVSKPTTFQYPTRKKIEWFEALGTRDFARANELDAEIQRTNNKRGWNL
jgi:hypothetical protein